MSWLSGTTIICFATSYAISLLLEASRLVFQIPSRFLLLVGVTAAGWLAHSVFLVEQVSAEAATRGVVPLSSWHDFCLVAAWFIAGTYLGLSIRRPANTVGIFVLPLVLALVGAAFVVRDIGGFPPQRALSTWKIIHGIALSLGTAAVTLGFATGTMYLVQAYRLKHKLLPRPGLRLPSLEWLQRFNRESLVISTCLLAIGLLSGVVLNLGHAGGNSNSLEWTDPVVLSSGVLFAWLLAIVLFEVCYRPARQGRKIAYLTLASFLFLLLVLGFVLAAEHATESPAQVVRPTNGNPRMTSAVKRRAESETNSQWQNVNESNGSEYTDPLADTRLHTSFMSCPRLGWRILDFRFLPPATAVFGAPFPTGGGP